MILESKESQFKPHPEGVYNAVCVDVIDQGLVESEFQGEKRLVHKLRLMFETDAQGEDGKVLTVGKTFTASLHPKARLAGFLGQWRGRQVVPGEQLDLDKLIGASCVLVIAHILGMDGKHYASITAASKASKKLNMSGNYNGTEVRKRMDEWKAKNGKPAAPAAPVRAAAPTPVAALSAALHPKDSDDVGF